MNPLEALLNADEGALQRQFRGVDREGTFAFIGAECVERSGHLGRDNFTVAGNILTGEDVLEAATANYAANAVHETTERHDWESAYNDLRIVASETTTSRWPATNPR